MDRNRLALSRRLGANVTINTCEERFREVVDEYTEERGFRFVFETAGVSPTMRLPFELTGKKSRVCFIGMRLCEV